MNINEKIDKKEWILEFIPKDLLYLTENKKITFENSQLKTGYLTNIINYMICKYYNSSEKDTNLSSVKLREWYGTHYCKYMKYLLNHGIIELVSSYSVGNKAKTYKLNDVFYNDNMLVRYKNTTKTLLAKWKANKLAYINADSNSYIINSDVKKMLISDLYHVKLNKEKAVSELNELYNSRLNEKSYSKNMISIDSIVDGTLYFTEDEYGRFHTNFTSLKRKIRQECLTIDGENVCELDIPNSQPSLLLSLLKDNGFHLSNPKEYEYYKSLVKNGSLYDVIADLSDITRTACKRNLYYLLFSPKSYTNKIYKSFIELFPNIYKWIIDIKNEFDYKYIAHQLQRKESCLIFDKIIKSIKEKYSHIKLFTIHDSIVFPKKYFKEVNEIFQFNVLSLFA